jgi:hypothetical protein
MTESESQLLDVVLDTIIPPSADRRLPGAGEAGLGAAVQLAMAGVVEPGLAALPADFAELPLAGRQAALEALAASQPGFVPGLLFHSYVSYYQDARVVEALGLEARPPFPKGYEMEPNDLTLLDAVRERPSMVRET